jgi:co-chaperonin GroES (HSP10)
MGQAPTINFNPTRDWVVLPLIKKNQTESGLYLTNDKLLKTNILKVVAVGPDCKVKVGDTVMVHPESQGLIIDLEEGQFVMVNEFMICGTIDKTS